LPNRLARPNPVFPDRRVRQEFADADIRNVGAAKLIRRLRTAFSRERFSQLLLMEGLPPAAAIRLDHSDVAAFRAALARRVPALAHTQTPRLTFRKD
jgi:hypothetical protein